jgi:hypothetical protein
MPFLGYTPDNTFHTLSKQTITGDGGTSYTLTNPVVGSNDIEVFVNNVRQEPSVAYTASDTSIVFTSAVQSSDSIYVVYQGKALGLHTVQDNTISTGKIVDSAVTQAKIADGAVTAAKIASTANITVASISVDTAIAAMYANTTVSGNTTLDFSSYQDFKLTLTGNVTLVNPTTEQVGQSGVIVFIQDATGSRTVSLGTDYETPGNTGITLSTAASTTDLVPYKVIASGRILLGTPYLAYS